MKNNQETAPKSHSAWLTAARVVAFLFVIGISIYVVLMPEEQTRNLESYGYLGTFLISILANATVIIPVPGLLIVFSMAARFNPLLIALAAGAGAAIGELSGYLAGFSGQGIIEDQRRYDQMVAWMRKNGPLTILVLAFIPNPLFDLAGMIAGALRMPIYRFLFWALIGKVLKMAVFAYAGAGVFSSDWLIRWFGH